LHRNLLADIVGNDVLDDFQAQAIDDYIDTFREFEIKKRSFTTGMQSKITLRIPTALAEFFKAKTHKSLGDYITEQSRFRKDIEWTAGKLRINPSVAEGLFANSCDSMVAHLKELFKTEVLTNVDVILMVGGFSESPLLQEKIKTSFPRKKIIIPSDAGLAVLKGAVIYGHDPSVIQERRARYTYGVGTSFPFKEGVDPEDKRLDIEGKSYCNDKFSLHVTIGQPLKFGEAQVVKSYNPASPDQKAIKFEFYATTEKEPNFVTDKGCTQIGNCKITIAGTGIDRAVEVRMIFSGTELYAEAEDTHTKTKTSAVLNFLG